MLHSASNPTNGKMDAGVKDDTSEQNLEIGKESKTFIIRNTDEKFWQRKG